MQECTLLFLRTISQHVQSTHDWPVLVGGTSIKHGKKQSELPLLTSYVDLLQVSPDKQRMQGAATPMGRGAGDCDARLVCKKG